MQLSNEVFDIVGLTAVGLLMDAVHKLGIEFTPEKFAEVVLSNKTDDPQEIREAIDELIASNLLLLQKGRYFINSDFIK